MWIAVLAASLGCYLEKVLGYFLPSSMLESARTKAVLGLMPVALLAALVAVQTFASGMAITLDARAAGLGAAIIALVLRAPFLVVVLVAAITAAGLRALGWSS